MDKVNNTVGLEFGLISNNWVTVQLRYSTLDRPGKKRLESFPTHFNAKCHNSKGFFFPETLLLVSTISLTLFLY